LLEELGPPIGPERNRVFRELRQQSWLVRGSIGGMVIDREHVQLLLNDRRLRSPFVAFIEMQGVTKGVLHDRMCKTLLALDGADHTRLRKLVRKAFVPAAVDRHRPLMRSILESLLEPVRDEGRCDFTATVAEHYPIQVMCDVLGVPAEDHEDFTQWIKAIAWSLSLELAAHFEEAEAGAKALDDYVTELVAARQQNPRGDLVTELVQAEEEGDRLSDDELHSLVIGLLFAGYDTTRNQLGLGMWLFAQHPDQWALLAKRPDLAPKAVEEVMRVAGAVDSAPRMVAEDFELDGYRLEAGTLLFLSTAAANQDEAAFDQPHQFDITADRQPQLTFGGGPHYCLGAHLARAEMQEAFPLLAAAMPGLELDGEPTWRPPAGIFGPDALPLRFVTR
jgi:cytochrome P450